MEKDLIEAKKYLSEQGYGSGTNYTTHLVAVLLSNYAQYQVNKFNKPVLSGRFCPKCDSKLFFDWGLNEWGCRNCGG